MRGTSEKSENLTLKQRLFVEAYLGEAKGNGVEAARIAGYSGGENVLAVQASENLRNPKIASRVRERTNQAAMSADEVLAELTDIAKADWRDFLAIKRNGKGEIVDATLLLKDKIRALELLGKYHGMFKEAERNPRQAARQALADLRAKYPELSEEQARRIVSETFNVQESELVN